MEVETWDDDFDGAFTAYTGASLPTAQTSVSSRLSVRSESVAGADEDWNLVIDSTSNDKKQAAIESAQQAGVPLPSNVPTSALLGGTIKRLGKKKSRQRVNDDWENDLEMPDEPGALQLKPRAIQPPGSGNGEENDDFDELEGSLGIRFAGRDAIRSSSVSAMSPSLRSMSLEGDEDMMRDLELPEGPVDFEAKLKGQQQKRGATEADLSDLSQPSPALEQPATMNHRKKSKLLSDDNDDYLNDFDFDAGEAFDTRKRTINKNIKVKNTKPTGSAQRPATTINFHDKPVDKPMRSHIPRPVSGSKPGTSRLEPVFETGASHMIRERRQPTTTSAQLLRSKRSMPALRSHQPTVSSMQKQPGPTPSWQSGPANNQFQIPAAHRPLAYHMRRDSDPRRGAQSPPLRPSSRSSNANVPDTPSRGLRQRPDVAPSALAREAAAKKTLTKPARRRNYGDGNELEIFDDLPTSTTKESKYIKQPIGHGPPKQTHQKQLRQTQSRSDIRDLPPPSKRNTAIPDRMVTPAPPRTPVSPTKGFYDGMAAPPSNTPSYLRDTAASRIARESRLTHASKPSRSEREGGPLMPLTTNWKAAVAARSPHTSPSAQRDKKERGKRAQPQLIRGWGAQQAKTEKGMFYNPTALRWEGNENTLHSFDIGPALETPTPTGHNATSYMDSRQYHSSPPRPALIAPISASAAQGVQVNGGMVFDPRQMKWLKLKEGRDVSGPLSPSVTDAEEEEDAFAGIEDLKDEYSPHPLLGGGGAGAGGGGGGQGLASPVSIAAAGVGEVHEEFDLGPKFIESQRLEEGEWRRRCGGWFLGGEEPRVDDGGWRWGIRDIAGVEGLQEQEMDLW